MTQFGYSDKGSDSMKFHVEFINDIKSGSRNSVHSFCLFEALDSTKNMSLIFKQFREFLYEL